MEYETDSDCENEDFPVLTDRNLIIRLGMDHFQILEEIQSKYSNISMNFLVCFKHIFANSRSTYDFLHGENMFSDLFQYFSMSVEDAKLLMNVMESVIENYEQPECDTILHAIIEKVLGQNGLSPMEIVVFCNMINQRSMNDVLEN
jgi:hypothetical protein